MNSSYIEQEIQRLFREAKQEIETSRRLIQSLNTEKEKHKIEIKHQLFIK